MTTEYTGKYRADPLDRIKADLIEQIADRRKAQLAEIRARFRAGLPASFQDAEITDEQALWAEVDRLNEVIALQAEVVTTDPDGVDNSDEPITTPYPPSDPLLWDRYSPITAAGDLRHELHRHVPRAFRPDLTEQDPA